MSDTKIVISEIPRELPKAQSLALMDGVKFKGKGELGAHITLKIDRENPSSNMTICIELSDETDCHVLEMGHAFPKELIPPFSVGSELLLDSGILWGFETACEIAITLGANPQIEIDVDIHDKIEVVVLLIVGNFRTEGRIPLSSMKGFIEED